MAFMILLLMACPSKLADTAPTAEAQEPFSFAILTDLHVGEGFLDYAGGMWTDSGEGASSQVTDNVQAVVDKVNARASDLDFAVVLGDLTDSGESSELTGARNLLDGLQIPWIPLLGNHDVWPYAWDSANSVWAESETPTGDVRLVSALSNAYDGWDGLVLAEDVVVDPESGFEARYVNFRFDWKNFRFVAVDWITRVHAPGGEPGVGPIADIHNIVGGSWPFFTNEVEAWAGYPGHVIALAHHPPKPLVVDSFSLDEANTLDTFLAGQDAIWGFFAGHWHVDQVETVGDAALPVVVTPAAKDGGARIVSIGEDGTVSYEELL